MASCVERRGVGEVFRAATDLTPRTILDPRVGYRYLGSVTTQLLKLRGTVVLRAMIGASRGSNGTDTTGTRSLARSGPVSL